MLRGFLILPSDRTRGLAMLRHGVGSDHSSVARTCYLRAAVVVGVEAVELPDEVDGQKASKWDGLSPAKPITFASIKRN
jgi:hypothetical protein